MIDRCLVTSRDPPYQISNRKTGVNVTVIYVSVIIGFYEFTGKDCLNLTIR